MFLFPILVLDEFQGLLTEDCRRRVELVEIKSAPPVSLNLLLTEERRVSRSGYNDAPRRAVGTNARSSSSSVAG